MITRGEVYKAMRNESYDLKGVMFFDKENNILTYYENDSVVSHVHVSHDCPSSMRYFSQNENWQTEKTISDSVTVFVPVRGA